jgi:hypothetical protein
MLRKGDRANSSVRTWFADAHEDELFTSVLVPGEVGRGVPLGADIPASASFRS